MSKFDEQPGDVAIRPIARSFARELTREEVEMVAGGRIPTHTHATGPNGDDPGDPGSAI
jgi:hypothetical protein